MKTYMSQTVIEGRGEKFVRIQPGEYFVTSAPKAILSTVLGSCIAACIRNPFNGFGGLNHFMLPYSEEGQWGGVSAYMRYGNYAMEVLVNEVLKSGCTRAQMEIKLFGGADLYEGIAKIGTKNCEFVRAYLRNENMHIDVDDLGGRLGRRLFYQPSTGRASRRYLTKPQSQGLSRFDQSLSQLITKDQDSAGSMTMFNEGA